MGYCQNKNKRSWKPSSILQIILLYHEDFRKLLVISKRSINVVAKFEFKLYFLPKNLAFVCLYIHTLFFRG